MKAKIDIASLDVIRTKLATYDTLKEKLKRLIHFGEIYATVNSEQSEAYFDKAVDLEVVLAEKLRELTEMRNAIKRGMKSK